MHSKWDREEIFPKETLKQLADLGLAGMFVREESGGKRVSFSFVSSSAATLRDLYFIPEALSEVLGTEVVSCS